MNQRTVYSHLWSSPQSFAAKNYKDGSTFAKTSFNKNWAVAFWINFAIFLIVIVAGVIYSPVSGISISVPLLFSVIPLVYVLFIFGFAVILPSLFVYLSFLVTIVLSLVLIYLTAGTHPVWFVLSILFGIACVYYEYSQIGIIRSFLCLSSKILMANLSLILFHLITACVVVVLFQSACITAYVFTPHFYPIAFYLVFSCYWIHNTFRYVCYMTCAGVTGLYYFCSESGSTIFYLKRALTSSFGAAAIAAIYVSVIQFIKFIMPEPKKDDSTLKKVVIAILQFILDKCQDIVENMNIYGLTYCGMYGIPFTEGCRRWKELSLRKHANIVNISARVQSVLYIGFALMTFIFSFMIGSFIDELNGLMFATMAFVFFEFIVTTFGSITRAITVFWTESPRQLETLSKSAYEAATSALAKKLSSRKK